MPAAHDPKSWIDTTFRRIMIGFSFGDPAQMALVTGKPVPPEKVADQAMPYRGKLTHPTVSQILPVYDLTVRVRLPGEPTVKAVYLAPDKICLAWKRDGRQVIRVAVPRIDIHGMAVVELS